MQMDKFADYPTSLTAPARDAAAVVPNDLLDLSDLPRAIYVGQGGSVSVRMIGGQTVQFLNAQAGSFLPIRVWGLLTVGAGAGIDCLFENHPSPSRIANAGLIWSEIPNSNVSRAQDASLLMRQSFPSGQNVQ